MEQQDVARVGSRAGKARAGRACPPPTWAGLIPCVPEPRPVRGADPGAGEPEKVSCAVTVYLVLVVVVVPW